MFRSNECLYSKSKLRVSGEHGAIKATRIQRRPLRGEHIFPEGLPKRLLKHRVRLSVHWPTWRCGMIESPS